MILELFNCLLYIFALILYRLHHRQFDTYSLILTSYLATAIFCYLYQLSGTSPYHGTTLFPYLYLFICLLIVLSPLKGFQIKESICVNETSFIKILTWIYIITGIYSIIVTLPDALALFRQGEWGMLRQAIYNEDDVKLYHSAFEGLCKNIHAYMGPLGIILCFNEVAKKDKSIIKIALLFISWLGASFLDATLIASRGLIANLILNVFFCILIFKNSISRRVSRILIVFALILVIPLFAYMMVVSFSRFGEDGAGDSIFFYLGHSMLCFNDSMMGSMHDYAMGKYAFNYFLPFFGLDQNINYTSLGFNEITSFFTVFGSFYIDLGPYLTLPFCILFALFLRQFTKQNKIRISHLICIIFFYSFILDGVFVIGPGYALPWMITIVLYYIIKMTETKKI